MEELQQIITNIASRDNTSPTDFVGEDGLRRCGVCGQPKQCHIDLAGRDMVVPCTCRCEREQMVREEAEKRARRLAVRVERLRESGMTDAAYSRWTFSADDGSRPKESAACRRYVEKWEDMLQKNIGILFYGGVGTGKTFFACCIANALIERGVPVLVTNLPRLIGKMQGGFDKATVADRLQEYDLLVLDDLGAERDTDFALEQIFSAVDTRYRSGKPMIVTTNLTPSQLKNPEDIRYSRVFDRVLQGCYPIKIDGESRRTALAGDMRREAARMLWEE